MGAKVLIVENDPMFVYLVKKMLDDQGYELHIAYDGNAGWKMYNEMQFDICLMDINMPGLDGYELARKIREIDTQLPIIHMSSNALQESIITALETGADDYLVKPVHPEELQMRMKVFLKLAARATGRKVYTFGKYILDMERQVLTIGDTKVNLPTKELKILSVLAKNIKTTVTSKNIIQEVWNGSGGKIERPLHIFIHRIRKHLKADPRVEIETIRNVGYRLEVYDGIR